MKKYYSYFNMDFHEVWPPKFKTQVLKQLINVKITKAFKTTPNEALYNSRNEWMNEFSQTSLKGQGLLLLEQGIACVCSIGEQVL